MTPFCSSCFILLYRRHFKSNKCKKNVTDAKDKLSNCRLEAHLEKKTLSVKIVSTFTTKIKMVLVILTNQQFINTTVTNGGTEKQNDKKKRKRNCCSGKCVSTAQLFLKKCLPVRLSLKQLSLRQVFRTTM